MRVRRRIHRALELATVACALVGAVACARRDAPREPSVAAAAPGRRAAPVSLDAAVVAHWKAAGVTPVAEADELTLLRRASLDLQGRIPTLAELDAFVSAPSDARYEQAIDRMLASDDHARHLAATWSDVMLDGAIKERPATAGGLRHYLESRFTDDVGFEQITRELLTASGDLPADGAGGFLAAHGLRGRTAAVAGETARVFLAAQIQCAQCHDHPSAPFAQREFYAFAAHFARTRVRPQGGADKGGVRILDRPVGQQHLPRPEDPPDDPGGAVVAPAYFGAPTQVGNGTRREALASAIVRDRRFALAVANRTWAQMFGRGLVMPIDDIPLGAEVPPLLNALADELVANDFAIDPVLRSIALGPAYRLDSRGPAGAEARIAAFAQSAVRPLSLEPLVRSLAVAGADDDVSIRRLLERRKGEFRELRFAFDDDEGASDDEGPNLQAALLWLRGNLTAMVASATPGRALDEILREQPSDTARVEALWRRFYGHVPTDDQQQSALAYLRAHDGNNAAYEDLVHAMVTSSEFTSNH